MAVGRTGCFLSGSLGRPSVPTAKDVFLLIGPEPTPPYPLTEVLSQLRLLHHSTSPVVEQWWNSYVSTIQFSYGSQDSKSVRRKWKWRRPHQKSSLMRSFRAQFSDRIAINSQISIRRWSAQQRRILADSDLDRTGLCAVSPYTDNGDSSNVRRSRSDLEVARRHVAHLFLLQRVFLSARFCLMSRAGESRSRA
jgi:hypothetical protein